MTGPAFAAPAGHRPHVVVVGGGITGLAAAHLLASTGTGAEESVSVTVVDGATDVGGKLRLGDVAGQQVDLGAEAILNRRPEAVDLARAVGLADAITHPATTAAGIWTGGAVRRLPPTLLGIPADLVRLRASGILDEDGVRQVAAEREFPALDLSDDESVGAVVARRLGPQVRDRLVEPLLGGVYAGRSDELSIHATMPAVVAAVARHGGLLAAAEANVSAARAAPDGNAAPVFAGLLGGVGRLAVETAEAVRRLGVEVRTSAMVRELHRRDGGWRLVVGPASAPEVVDADAVLLACPATTAARLLAGAVPVAAELLAEIDYASVALVTLALRRDADEQPLAGSGFLVPPVDGKTVKAATYSSTKWDWVGTDLEEGAEVVRCSIGRYREQRHLQYDDAELVREALAELEAATGQSRVLVDSVVTRWGGALPQYAVGHLDRVRRARAAIADAPRLEICGAGLDGVGIPACVGSGRAAATRVLTSLGAADRGSGRMDT